MIRAPAGWAWLIFGGRTHGSLGHLVDDAAPGPPFVAICGARQHRFATGQTRLGYLKRDGYAKACHRCVAALPALAEPPRTLPCGETYSSPAPRGFSLTLGTRARFVAR